MDRGEVDMKSESVKTHATKIEFGETAYENEAEKMENLQAPALIEVRYPRTRIVD